MAPARAVNDVADVVGQGHALERVGRREGLVLVLEEGVAEGVLGGPGAGRGQVGGGARRAAEPAARRRRQHRLAAADRRGVAVVTWGHRSEVSG